MKVTTGVYLLNEKKEEMKGSGLSLTDDKRFAMQWLSFTRYFYASDAEERKLTFFLPSAQFQKTLGISNIIVVPKDYPDGIIPTRVDRYNHYNLLVQFYEKTKDNRVLFTIQYWKQYCFGKLPPIPKPRAPKPKPRTSLLMTCLQENFFCDVPNYTGLPDSYLQLIPLLPSEGNETKRRQNSFYKNGRF